MNHQGAKELTVEEVGTSQVRAAYIDFASLRDEKVKDGEEDVQTFNLVIKIVARGAQLGSILNTMLPDVALSGI